MSRGLFVFLYRLEFLESDEAFVRFPAGLFVRLPKDVLGEVFSSLCWVRGLSRICFTISILAVLFFENRMFPWPRCSIFEL